MITRSDLLSVNDKYRAWLVNDNLLPPERDLSVQLTTKSELYTPSRKQENTFQTKIKQEKTLNSDQILNKQEKTLDSSQTLNKREETLDSDIEL